MTLVEWLKSCSVSDVSAVTLRIDKKIWDGALYTTDTGNHLYAIGDLPKEWVRRNTTYFVFPEDERQWYVACYLTNYDELNDQQQEHHPFGNSFMLKVWENIDHAIDEFDSYKQVHAYLTRE